MYDFAIIGGGIVGLSTSMIIGQLYPSARILVLEKENSWALHQSGDNSGVIHSGIYYKPGSDKAKLCRDGNHSLVNFCQDNEIDYEACGKVIVATDKKELFLLEELYKRGLENGFNVTRVSAKEVQEIEPYVHCLAGIRVATTGIVDYQQVCQKYIDLIRNQGELWLNTKDGIVDDFLIVKSQHAIHVCNAPSPAATSSLEIGKAIARQIPEQSHLKVRFLVKIFKIFKLSSIWLNSLIKELAEIIAEVFPECQLSFGSNEADNRSYRVAFAKIHQTLPEFKCEWSALRGAQQLFNLFTQIDLGSETFLFRGHTRLNQLEHLIHTQQIDRDFFWRQS